MNSLLFSFFKRYLKFHQGALVSLIFLSVGCGQSQPLTNLNPSALNQYSSASSGHSGTAPIDTTGIGWPVTIASGDFQGVYQNDMQFVNKVNQLQVVNCVTINGKMAANPSGFGPCDPVTGIESGTPAPTPQPIPTPTPVPAPAPAPGPITSGSGYTIVAGYPTCNGFSSTTFIDARQE